MFRDEHSFEEGVSASHFYNRPAANASATQRTRKTNFLKSPFATAGAKQGFTMDGRHTEKGPEEAPGPGMYEFKSKAVEGPEYSIYGKYPTNTSLCQVLVTMNINLELTLDALLELSLVTIKLMNFLDLELMIVGIRKKEFNTL